MSIGSPYRDALLAWTDTRKAKFIGKDDLLRRAHESERYPTGEEEDVLRQCIESASVPEEEWGAVCLLAERIRRSRAEESLKDEAEAQVQGAERHLALGRGDYLRWPWASLDALVGGMAPGTLHYIICPSKGGKTTLCRSATALWCKAGKRILYGGFEMKAETLRTMFAADDVGIDPGHVVSGAWLDFPNHADLKERMKSAYHHQRDPSHWYQNLRFTSYEFVGPKEIREMMALAADWKADAVVIDHVDNLDGAGKSEISTSEASNKLLLRLTKRHDLKTIITSQTNNTNKSTDRWRDHRPLRDEYVRYGDIKKQVATTMIGLVRPVRPGLTKAEKDAVEWGDKPLSDALWPGINLAHLMASRTYGSRIGQRAHLGWERGRIVDAPTNVQAEVDAAKHGIRTNRDI